MMNKKSKRSAKTEPNPSLWDTLGPALDHIKRRLAPPDDARRHFQTARVEVLKGIRALLDARIEQRSRSKAKGEPIRVE